MNDKPNKNNNPRGGSRPQAGRGNPAQGQNKAPRPKGGPLGPNGFSPSGATRSAAIRASRRISEDATKIASQYLDATQTQLEMPIKPNQMDDIEPKLRVIGLGGMDGGGSKNMVLIEYGNDAVVVDCGNDLGVDLPGINYGIPDITYLKSISHKLRGYIITHGHLDHIGGLPHIMPEVPAPVYGSRFTIGRVEEIFQNFGLPLPEGFELKTVIMNDKTHERLIISPNFTIELVSVTHSIPGSTIVIIDTPAGRIVNTGDFRLDPNPLDHEKTDTDRLIELGKEGVRLLLSESTTTERPGRTPSESTIEQSFVDIMDRAPGRIFVAIFSTNVNRIQMIINAAVHHNRKVAMDGRSMVSTLEMAVRNGFVKVPKGTFVPMQSINSVDDDKVVIVCTGGQAEPSAALMRMSDGSHRHVKMKAQDTVILSSTPIPETGNDARIGTMVDNLMKMGVHVLRQETRELDNHGPLHVSGHASIDEYADMIGYLKPDFFVPIYGPYRSKSRHIDIAVEMCNIPRANCLNVENGDVITITKDKMSLEGQVPHGTVLVDQNGYMVSNVVVKDRVLLAEEGLVAIVLTIDRRSGLLATSPDIISRGFIYMKGQEELMTEFRNELKRVVQQRFRRVDLERFKTELKEHVTYFIYERTQRSPIVIPVVNIVGGAPQGSSAQGRGPRAEGRDDGRPSRPTSRAPRDESSDDGMAPGYVEEEVVDTRSSEELAAEQQKRFAEMRARLLGQDARTD